MPAKIKDKGGMNIKSIPVELIKPYALNAKRHPEWQIKAIAGSIKSFGFNQPIVINEKMDIVVGHGRYLAAKELGLREIPCVELDYLTEDEIKAYRIIDNKLNEVGWDDEFLVEDLKRIDFDFGDFNIDFSNVLDDLEEPDFNELTAENNNKPPIIKITFASENDLQNAEAEIAKIVSKYQNAFYSVSAGEL